MQRRRTFTVMAILLAVLILGVGYATVANVTLNLTGTGNIKANADFSVEYDTTHTVVKNTNDTITDGANTHPVVAGAYTDTANATMTVWFDNDHREAYAIYKVDNKSSELSARLRANVTQVGSQYDAYFTDVTATYYTDANCATALGTDELTAGASAYLKVEISLEKSPLDDITGATFSVTTTAEPVEAD